MTSRTRTRAPRHILALTLAGALALTGCSDDGEQPETPASASANAGEGAGGAAPRDATARATLERSLLEVGVAGKDSKAQTQAVIEHTVALDACGLGALPSNKERLGGLSLAVAGAELEVVQRVTLYRAGSAESALSELRQMLLGCSLSAGKTTVMPKVIELGVGGYNNPVFAVEIKGGLSALTRPQAVARPEASGAPSAGASGAPASAAGEEAPSAIEPGVSSIILISKRGPVVSSAVLINADPAEAKRVAQAMVAALTKSVPNPEEAAGASASGSPDPAASISPPSGAPAPYVPGLPAPAGG